MSEWSEKVIEIISKHFERKNSIQNILEKLLNGLEYIKNIELTNTDKLVWEVQIALKTFTLTNEEILLRQEVTKTDEDGNDVLTGEMRDLEKVIQELILEKIS